MSYIGNTSLELVYLLHDLSLYMIRPLEVLITFKINEVSNFHCVVSQ
jgi:hypothetical protein